MITPNPQDAKHKVWLFRLLSAIANNAFLVSVLYFKGGTCAAMRGFLDRFSVDLDFDYLGEKKDIAKAQKEMEKIFKKLGLEIKDRSRNIPQYFLKYESKAGERNTLKIDISFPPPKSNRYESVEIIEIDRIINCQTIETMFANKLVALIERYEKTGSIASRDLYDIHHFFMQGFRYNAEIIQERRNQEPLDFIEALIEFIKKEITQTIVDQDLNTLLEPKKIRQIRKILKQESLVFLQDELSRLRK